MTSASKGETSGSLAQRFFRLPRLVQALVLPAWVLLGLSRALIVFVPFQRLAPHLGEPTGTAPWLPLVSKEQARRAALVGTAIRIAANRTPWTSNCFPQAVTARCLLRMFGIPHAVCFGLRRETGSAALQAHAWVSAGPVAATGGQSFDRYTVVGSFVAGPRPRQ